MNDPKTPPTPAHETAASIVDAIRELNRHIERQRWSSNCAAMSDRTRLVNALVAMSEQSNVEVTYVKPSAQ
jgi:hypothetical protein